MSRINIGARDLVWAYIGNLLKLSINILLLPFIIHFLTGDELGLWYVFSSIGQIAILLDFGFAPALARNISYVWCGANALEKENVTTSVSKETDWVFMKQVLLTCRYVYLIISLIAIIFLLTAGSIYIKSLTPNLKDLLSWIVYSIGIFLNLLYSYYSSFLLGVGAVAEHNKATVYSKLAQFILSTSFLYLGAGLLGVSIVYVLSGFLIRILSRHYFYRYQDIEVNLKNVKLVDKYRKCVELFKIIWYNASKDGLVTISNFLFTQANVLISSSVIGLASTGFYGMAVQLSTIISNVSAIPYSTFHPLMQEKAVKMDINGSMSVFSRSILIFLGFFVILSIGSMLFLPILSILKPEMEINVRIYIVVLVYMLMYQIYHLFASYISTFNIIPYNKAFITSSVLSVLLSFVFARFAKLGIWSLVLAPIVVTAAYNLWKWPLYVLQYTKFSCKEFFNLGLRESHIYVVSLFNKYKKNQ